MATYSEKIRLLFEVDDKGSLGRLRADIAAADGVTGKFKAGAAGLGDMLKQNMAAGAMAAHYARGGHGKGQHVDVSIQEVAFSRNVNGVLVWNFDRRKLHRVGGALNYGVSVLLVITLPNLFGAYPALAVAAGSLAGLAANFTLSKRFVFAS